MRCSPANIIVYINVAHRRPIFTSSIVISFQIIYPHSRFDMVFFVR